MKSFKHISLSSLILCFLALNIVKAQKLPNVQKNNMFIPGNCRIDGKATEWDDKFQAYNTATEVYYTMANDSKNLYVIFKAINPIIADKIMRGGITFTVAAGNKKDKSGQSAITYPLIRQADRRMIDQEMYASKKNADNSTQVETDDKLTAEQLLDKRDSIAAKINRKLVFIVNEIQVSNINGVTDSLISIYNEYGIKAILTFDSKNHLTYELEIPLERLKTTGNLNELTYNVRLNPPPPVKPLQIKVRPGDYEGLNGTITVFQGIGVATPENMTPRMAEIIAAHSPTDFWGKYILIKK